MAFIEIDDGMFVDVDRIVAVFRNDSGKTIVQTKKTSFKTDTSPYKIMGMIEQLGRIVNENRKNN